jgi:hypothetical protein
MFNAFQNIKPHPAAKGKLIVPKTLLSVSSDAKTSKGEKVGYLTGILYLAPGTLAGVGNMCVFASKGCALSCLWKAGRASMFKAINKSRVMKTRYLHDHREAFISLLLKDVASLVRKANRLGLTPVLRLNGTSDLPIENLFKTVFDTFPDLVTYDYTKSLKRAIAWGKGELPNNYHITFSLSESNRAQAAIALRAGVNVAAVTEGFTEGETIPFDGLTVETVNGDSSDLRFLDSPSFNGQGKFVILKAKGPAKKDTTGFVIRKGATL